MKLFNWSSTKYPLLRRNLNIARHFINISLGRNPKYSPEENFYACANFDMGFHRILRLSVWINNEGEYGGYYIVARHWAASIFSHYNKFFFDFRIFKRRESE